MQKTKVGGGGGGWRPKGRAAEASGGGRKPRGRAGALGRRRFKVKGGGPRGAAEALCRGQG